MVPRRRATTEELSDTRGAYLRGTALRVRTPGPARRLRRRRTGLPRTSAQGYAARTPGAPCQRGRYPPRVTSPQRAPGGFPVVGIVGGGQLARMCAGPAAELAITLSVLAESPDAAAAQVIPS